MTAGFYALNCTEETIQRRLFKIVRIFVFALIWFIAYAVLSHWLDGNLIEWIKDELSIVNYLHKNQDRVLNMVSKMHLIIAALIGILISLSHLVFKIRIDFSCVGVFILSTSLFVIAMKYKDVSISSGVEYLGNYLSLNVYIFHSIIAGIFIIIANRLLGIDTTTGWFPWVNPLLTVFVSIMVAYIINSFKKGNV